MSDINRRQFLSYMAVLPCSMLFTANSDAASRHTGSKRLQGVIHELDGEVFINKNALHLQTRYVQAIPLAWPMVADSYSAWRRTPTCCRKAVHWNW